MLCQGPVSCALHNMEEQQQRTTPLFSPSR